MDGKRFDELSRAFAQGRTRRGVLKGLAGGLAAGVAALTGRGSTAAQRLPLGSACSRATQCASFKCADGVCCDSQCTGQCEACDLQGSLGTCTPVPAGTQQWGDRPACTGTDVCQASCDGVERRFCTQYPGFDIPCNTGECVNGWGITYGCGGDGTCHPLGESCGLYVCDAAGVACLTSCTTDDDCLGEAFCDTATGTCQEDRPLGEDCTADDQCASGICAQGVCCATACPGACQACNLDGNRGFCTEIPDGGPCTGGTCCDGECVDLNSSLEHCGQCDHSCDLTPNGPCENEPICQAGTCTFTPQPGPNIVLCRDAVDICDVAEYCDGVSIVCPADQFKPNTVECRPAADVCDVAEFCTGTGPSCPPDLLRPSTFECRASAGDCDVAEFCTGRSVACPPDVFQPNTFECRASAGICDRAEFCTGNGPSCPPDSFQPSTFECRSVAGDCDVAEFCTGNSAQCPADTFLPNTTVCRAANPAEPNTCDLTEVCTGNSATCPADAVKDNGTVCRPATCTAGAEVAAGICNGASNICPPPGTPVPCTPYTCNDAGTACRSSCTIDDHCVSDHFCDVASGQCRPRALTISGGPNPSTPFQHDDNIEIYVNGVLVHSAGYPGSPSLTVPALPGSSLRVVAIDTICGARFVSPIYVHRSGVSQTLDATGIPIETSPGCNFGDAINVVFYDETYTITI